MSDAAPKPFVFDSFVATSKNISFLSDGKQYVADVEKFDEMNPSNVSNGRYNHWNLVNMHGDILHNLFESDDFDVQSAVFTVRRGKQTGTQEDRLDVRPPLKGCNQVNLCQHTSEFFALDKLDESLDIRNDIREYVETEHTLQTEAHPEGVTFKQLVMSTDESARHDEELRKYPSVKYMFHGFDTVNEALSVRFAPSGDFRTPDEDFDVGSGWQYLKSFKADEQIAIFNDIFDRQKVTLFADAVSTKTYYDDTYSVDGREYAYDADGKSVICLNDGVDKYGEQYVTDAVMIDDKLGYAVVYIDADKDWQLAFPDDPLSHNIFEFTLRKCKWLDQSNAAMSFVLTDETGLDVQKAPYAYLAHRGCQGYQVGAQCVGGVLKVRFSIPYDDPMTLDEFKKWVGTIGRLRIRHNPDIPDADARHQRYISLDGTETWELNGGVFETTFTEKSCDAFVRKRSLARMPVKFSYIGATEKDFTQSVPYNSMKKNTFTASGRDIGMADAALAGCCETAGDSTTVKIRLRFWRGSYDITTVEQVGEFFKRRPLLIKTPRAGDVEEAAATQRRDRFFMDSDHMYEVRNVRNYRNVDVCGSILYMVYQHRLKTQSDKYKPKGVGMNGFIPMTVYHSEMSDTQPEPLDDDMIDTLVADPDRNKTDIDVMSNYETVESVYGINRLGTGGNSIKSNIFSISISNLGLDYNASLSESDKDRIKRWISEKVVGIAKRIAPANTQLFKTFLSD